MLFYQIVNLFIFYFWIIFLIFFYDVIFKLTIMTITIYIKFILFSVMIMLKSHTSVEVKYLFFKFFWIILYFFECCTNQSCFSRKRTYPRLKVNIPAEVFLFRFVPIEFEFQRINFRFNLFYPTCLPDLIIFDLLLPNFLFLFFKISCVHCTNI